MFQSLTNFHSHYSGPFKKIEENKTEGGSIDIEYLENNLIVFRKVPLSVVKKELLDAGELGPKSIGGIIKGLKESRVYKV